MCVNNLPRLAFDSGRLGFEPAPAPYRYATKPHLQPHSGETTTNTHRYCDCVDVVARIGQTYADIVSCSNIIILRFTHRLLYLRQRRRLCDRYSTFIYEFKNY